MDTVVFTPRLKLTLITKAEKGSPEFEWIHEIKSDRQATRWSITGTSKSIEDTEKFIKGFILADEGENKTYRIIYAVHEFIDSAADSTQPTSQTDRPTRFVGTMHVWSWNAASLVLPEQFTLPNPDKESTLYCELGYQFLPQAWGKGYASEALAALFEACERAPRSVWAPYTQVHVRAMVNEENPKSQRVMGKTNATHLGVYVWTGNPIWLNEQWTTRSELHIFGKFLLKQ